MGESIIHPEILETFYVKIEGFLLSDIKVLKKAAAFADVAHAGQLRKSGEPYIIHPIAVAGVLLELGMDTATIAAGLLHDVVEDTKYTIDDIKREFSAEVAHLVDGVTKISNIKINSKTEQEAQTIRKMFFAMANDPRVIIIKLADKLHNMSTLTYLDPVRAKEIAFECLDVFAPLADRLGMNNLKIQLEDESFKIINPKAYKLISDYIDEMQDSQSEFLSESELILRRHIKANGIENILITSRVKHMYSIYMKMKKRAREVHEIQDIYGMRVICENVVECYTILGIIHSLWTPVDGHFKDYIAMPKANNYQSLHTTVLINSNKRARQLEIQIRTFEMDAVANYGVASHWAYKAESGREKPIAGWNVANDRERYLKLVNRMQNWREEINGSENFMQDIKSNLLKDTIVVFTPKGKALELPLGSTALDFAYLIHTDIGNKCQMAKANGSIIPLSQPLNNTDIIEIITSQSACPNENWLKYAFTSSARHKIKAYLNKTNPQLLFTKDVVVKNLDKLKKKDPAEKTIKTNVKKLNDSSDIKIGKDKNIMISFAKCCHPVKGDKIIGYITRGRGVVIHKKDCHNLSHMTEAKERLIPVSWDDDKPFTICKFKVISKRIKDLFSEIEKAIKKFNAVILEGRVDDNDGLSVCGTFTIELPDTKSQKRLIDSIKSISAIEEIEII